MFCGLLTCRCYLIYYMEWWVCCCRWNRPAWNFPFEKSLNCIWFRSGGLFFQIVRAICMKVQMEAITYLWAVWWDIEQRIVSFFVYDLLWMVYEAVPVGWLPNLNHMIENVTKIHVNHHRLGVSWQGTFVIFTHALSGKRFSEKYEVADSYRLV